MDALHPTGPELIMPIIPKRIFQKGLYTRITNKTGIDYKIVKFVCEEMINQITECIGTGIDVHINKIGTFTHKVHNEKFVYSFKNKAMVRTQKYIHPYFKPTSEYTTKVNNMLAPTYGDIMTDPTRKIVSTRQKRYLEKTKRPTYKPYPEITNAMTKVEEVPPPPPF